MMINLSNTLKRKNSKKGFTLIELIVVIAILAILAAIAIPRFTRTQESAKLSADQATARTIASALTLAEASGDFIRGTSGYTYKSTITAGTAVANTYDSVIATLVGQNYLEAVKAPQTSGTFTVVVTGGVISITNGATTPVIFYPAP